VLDFFANLGFDPEGQIAVLKTDHAFQLILEGLECRHGPAREAAALALRNLAFAADGKAALLGKPRAVPALLRAVQTADGRTDLRLAARASAALWALLGRCEKAKVVLRAPDNLAQLRSAEHALTARGMLCAPAEGGAQRAALEEALRNMGAVMSILGL